MNRESGATIDVTINGRPRTVPALTTLGALVAELGLQPPRVAIERNRAIVKRTDWDGTRLEAGDTLEIVEFVGGG